MTQTTGPFGSCDLAEDGFDTGIQNMPHTYKQTISEASGTTIFYKCTVSCAAAPSAGNMLNESPFVLSWPSCSQPHCKYGMVGSILVQ